jgi:large subunit ribosomal protein L23
MHVLKPRLSEKAYAMSQATNTFVIDVPRELNKHEVAAAVEQQFEVSVSTVRIVNRKGKTKRVMNTSGKRSSNRKGVRLLPAATCHSSRLKKPKPKKWPRKLKRLRRLTKKPTSPPRPRRRPLTRKRRRNNGH